jgi:hypothetical protein
MSARYSSQFGTYRPHFFSRCRYITECGTILFWSKSAQGQGHRKMPKSQKSPSLNMGNHKMLNISRTAHPRAKLTLFSNPQGNYERMGQLFNIYTTLPLNPLFSPIHKSALFAKWHHPSLNAYISETVSDRDSRPAPLESWLKSITPAAAQFQSSRTTRYRVIGLRSWRRPAKLHFLHEICAKFALCTLIAQPYEHLAHASLHSRIPLLVSYTAVSGTKRWLL